MADRVSESIVLGGTIDSAAFAEADAFSFSGPKLG